MVALMKLPGYHVSPLLDLAPINEGLDSVAKARQLAAQNARLDKQDARADEQMGMEKQRFTAQQQDRMRKLLAGRSQMILDEPDDAKAAQIFQRHFSTPEIQAAIKENGLDPTDFRGVAKAIHAEALGPVDPLERKKTQAQIKSAEASAAASYGANRRADALLPHQIAEYQRKPQATYKEVNGKVVEIRPDGASRVVFDGGPDFTKLPEFSAKASGFAGRMVEAEKNIRDLMGGVPEKAGGPPREKFDPTSGAAWLANSLTGKPGESAMNFFVRPEDHQRYIQGARQWIRAFLRKESGAAISDTEFAEDFKTYFPQPGDAPGTIAQKAKARLEAKRSFINESRGYFDHTNPEKVGLFKQWNDEANPKDQTRLPGNDQPAPAAQQAAGPVRVQSVEEALRLPPGTEFLTPDGRLKRVPDGR